MNKPTTIKELMNLIDKKYNVIKLPDSKYSVFEVDKQIENIYPYEIAIDWDGGINKSKAIISKIYDLIVEQFKDYENWGWRVNPTIEKAIDFKTNKRKWTFYTRFLVY